jgi:dipeptidyl aminopeptidase/acylaminoacyl peptidase
MPVGTKKIRIKTETDTVIVSFSGNNYQPTFLKNGNDTIDLGFTIESVVFKSANGNKINGWFLKSKNITSTITLLHFHGNAGCLFSQYQTMTPLIKNGFQIFMFDYSGFGFSEGKAKKEDILIDAFSALDYLKSRQDVKNTKLIIYGQSLGGHLSAVVASQRQNDIDGLVIEGAFSSHKDIAANTLGIFGRIIVNEKYSAVKSIKQYKKPLLVIHSTEDKIIPFRMGRKIFENANLPKEFFEIKGKHILGPKYYADEISVKIKSMCIAN